MYKKSTPWNMKYTKYMLKSKRKETFLITYVGMKKHGWRYEDACHAYSFWNYLEYFQELIAANWNDWLITLCKCTRKFSIFFYAEKWLPIFQDLMYKRNFFDNLTNNKHFSIIKYIACWNNQFIKIMILSLMSHDSMKYC